MIVQIVIHNHQRVKEVIPGVNSMTITRAYDNRIIWADGDICAPFFVLPADVEVNLGDPVEEIRGQDISDSLDMTAQYLRLARRIEKIEEREK